jgi:hypothetical protein
MDIQFVLKEATRIKKEEGFTEAIEFLIGTQRKLNFKDGDLEMLLSKVFIYFKNDISNQKVNQFVFDTITENPQIEYRLVLSDFYWLISDFEKFKNTLINEISQQNPLQPWKYCYSISNLKFKLCEYYLKMGLEKKENSIDYLYNLIGGKYFELASEFILYSRNFNNLYSSLNFKAKLEFYHPDRIVGLKQNLQKIFSEKSIKLQSALECINCPLSNEKVIDLIEEHLFVIFPKNLGFKIDVLDRSYNDVISFTFSFLSKMDFKNIDILTSKINEWEVNIAIKTVDFADKHSNKLISDLSI